MSKFDELDGAICRHIETCPGRHPIYARELIALAAKTLGNEFEHGGDAEWRLVDRRLQAMRKAGRIIHEKATISGVGGWRVVGATKGDKAA